MDLQRSSKHPISVIFKKGFYDSKKYRFRRWVFTWNADSNGNLPSAKNLKSFLQQDDLFSHGVFQLEKGVETQRNHFQGRFELRRQQTRPQVLTRFEKVFNVLNLTVQKEECYDSTMYCTKLDTRIDGPHWFGPDSYLMENEVPKPLPYRQWQSELESLMLDSDNETRDELRDRKVVVVYDNKGNNGKSSWMRNIRLRRRDLVIRKLTPERPDRLRASVYKMTRKQTPDLLFVDLPRTLGKDTDLKGFFEALEEIKNGWVIDTMYGNYNEAIFTPPMVVIMTNIHPKKFIDLMSIDRWIIFSLDNDPNENWKQHVCLVKHEIVENEHRVIEDNKVDEKSKYLLELESGNKRKSFDVFYKNFGVKERDLNSNN